MALINVDNLTLNPQEAQSVSEVVFERIFNDGDIAKFHDVETGITMKKQILFAGRIGLLGKVSSGCTPNEAGGFSMTQKYWDPAREDFRLTHCADDVPTLFKVFKKAKRMNPDFYDRVGSEELGVIIAAVENAMIENLHRKIWFSDTAAAEIDNSGVFANGTDLAYWNTFNGLFKQVMADVTAGDTPNCAVSANAGTTYAGQALAEDAALDIFEQMATTADERLLSSGEAFILATRSLTDNYRASLRNKNLGSGYLEVVEDGRAQLYFDGIPVYTRYDWDRYIKEYQDNGTKWNLPHRAIMTVKENIPVGTLDEGDLNKLDVFYDKRSKSNYIDAVYTIDAKHLESYMTVTAY